MDCKVTYEEYLRILRYCTDIHHTHAFSSTADLLMDLLDANKYSTDGTLVISERLMRRVAIANLCDMCLTQYRDSNGEIDYAGLGAHTIYIINNILRAI